MDFKLFFRGVELVGVTVHLVLALFNLALDFVPAGLDGADLRPLAVDFAFDLSHL